MYGIPGPRRCRGSPVHGLELHGPQGGLVLGLPPLRHDVPEDGGQLSDGNDWGGGVEGFLLCALAVALLLLEVVDVGLEPLPLIQLLLEGGILDCPSFVAPLASPR